MNQTGNRILVVDDEKAIRRFLVTALSAHGHTVLEAAIGGEAITAVAHQHPDVVILDLGLPDMDGIEVTRRLREWSDIPIIILSVREHESDKIAALDAGADDYLTKPFSVRELMARLRAVQRRLAQPAKQAVFELRDLVMDLANRRVTVSDAEVSLTPTEYDLLRVLVTNAGKVLTHQYILRSVWGIGYEEETHLLRVNVSNLRRKIEADSARPRYILTEPGVGYRLQVEL
jgi:two-component system, OmpR family, KDP operon response regulator KdpE